MTTGMLWFDNSTLSLAEKVAKGAAYYAKKYGRAPELCLVHPNALTGQQLPSDMTITVRPYRSVLPSHFWIGLEDKSELQQVEEQA